MVVQPVPLAERRTNARNQVYRDSTCIPALIRRWARTPIKSYFAPGYPYDGYALDGLYRWLDLDPEENPEYQDVAKRIVYLDYKNHYDIIRCCASLLCSPVHIHAHLKEIKAEQEQKGMTTDQWLEDIRKKSTDQRLEDIMKKSGAKEAKKVPLRTQPSPGQRLPLEERIRGLVRGGGFPEAIGAIDVNFFDAIGRMTGKESKYQSIYKEQFSWRGRSGKKERYGRKDIYDLILSIDELYHSEREALLPYLLVYPFADLRKTDYSRKKTERTRKKG